MRPYPVDYDAMAAEVRQSAAATILRGLAIDGDGYFAQQDILRLHNAADALDAVSISFLAIWHDFRNLREERDALRKALTVTAEQALSTEIPDGYGPDLAARQEFHLGYDAAIGLARARLESIGGAQQPARATRTSVLDRLRRAVRGAGKAGRCA